MHTAGRFNSGPAHIFREVKKMPDREKVINDLQDAVNDDWMWQHADYYAKAMENAIALLKEQENASKRNPVIVCPHCGKRVK